MMTRDQYRVASEKYPNSVLFFKVGNAYEAYHSDATLCSIELDRPIRPGQFFPVVEIPSNQINAVINRLIRDGYNCALIDGDSNTLLPCDPTPEQARDIMRTWPEMAGRSVAAIRHCQMTIVRDGTAEDSDIWHLWTKSCPGSDSISESGRHGESFTVVAERFRANVRKLTGCAS